MSVGCISPRIKRRISPSGVLASIGFTRTSMHNPTEIKLRTRSRVLEVAFDDGARYLLPFEYLRVYSPSAEVKGHGPGQEVLVTGKQNVGIRAVEPVGQYAVKLVFDDGHDTGLYSWKYLRELGRATRELDEVPGAGQRCPIGIAVSADAAALNTGRPAELRRKKAGS